MSMSVAQARTTLKEVMQYAEEGIHYYDDGELRLLTERVPSYFDVRVNIRASIAANGEESLRARMLLARFTEAHDLRVDNTADSSAYILRKVVGWMCTERMSDESDVDMTKQQKGGTYMPADFKQTLMTQTKKWGMVVEGSKDEMKSGVAEILVLSHERILQNERGGRWQGLYHGLNEPLLPLSSERSVKRWKRILEDPWYAEMYQMMTTDDVQYPQMAHEPLFSIAGGNRSRGMVVEAGKRSERVDEEHLFPFTWTSIRHAIAITERDVLRLGAKQWLNDDMIDMLKRMALKPRYEDVCKSLKSMGRREKGERAAKEDKKAVKQRHSIRDIPQLKRQETSTVRGTQAVLSVPPRKKQTGKLVEYNKIPVANPLQWKRHGDSERQPPRAPEKKRRHEKVQLQQQRTKKRIIYRKDRTPEAIGLRGSHDLRTTAQEDGEEENTGEEMSEEVEHERMQGGEGDESDAEESKEEGDSTDDKTDRSEEGEEEEEGNSEDEEREITSAENSAKCGSDEKKAGSVGTSSNTKQIVQRENVPLQGKRKGAL
ncbi:hypothetical protein CBR_g30831 [Chara braunii]|uniref:Uncharacterized protein n=1 Tax=Chara braunii TaxID=69332 RepID=A0A388JXR7_CHABU|nr:hypothetical protein CBR_g30831 [Chara braunii]|eukprot:GBG62513.1 hypothetical protein CBR_g30831 [Chara braunii]